MADQPNIFGTNTQATPENNQGSNGNTPPPPNNTDPLADLLGSIKNERGEQKYRTVQEALTGLLHAQNHIQTLTGEKRQIETEITTLREKANKIDTLEQTLLELTQRKTPEPTPQPGISQEDIAKLVKSTLTEQQQAALAQANVSSVANKVKEVYGDKASEVFYGKAKEMGMTNEEFNALAAKSPGAVLKLVGIDGVKQPTGSPRPNGINTGGFTPQNDSFVNRNKNQAIVGATTQDLMQETQNAKSMVEELHSQGLSTYDLTDPKVFFKHFGK